MKRKMKYKVKVEEVYKRFITVEADSSEEAEEVVADMFNKELFVLTADDFDYREIFAVGVAE